MKKYLQTALAQWLLGVFLAGIMGGGLWLFEMAPLIADLNVLSQNNHHISQKLKSVRQQHAGVLWSAPQLYRWLSVSQKRFGVQVVSVSAQREGIELVLAGPFKNMLMVLQQLSASGLKSLWWQHDAGQMTLLLNAISVQEVSADQDRWVGEAGSEAQRYCIYQHGSQIKMLKKGAHC